MKAILKLFRSWSGCLAAMGLLSIGSSVHAQVLYLSWDDCTGNFRDKAFDCSTTQGAFELLGSFATSEAIEQIDGFQVHVLVFNASPWWNVAPEGCRDRTWYVSPSTQEPGCVPLEEAISWGTRSTQVGEYTHLDVELALSSPHDFVAGEKRYLFTMTFENRRADVCSGCCAGACIAFERLDFYRAGEEVATMYGDFGNGAVSWQGGVCGVRGGPIVTSASAGCLATPVSTSSWGRIKTIYR